MPVGVEMASLTPPCGSENAAASIASLMPRSGIAAPRAISSVVFTSRPALFGRGGEVFRVLQVGGDRRRALLGQLRGLLAASRRR